MRVRALFIDLDGVLRRWPDSDKALELAHGLPAGILRQTAFSPELLQPAITGQISDEEWRARVISKIGENYGAARASEAVRQWSEQTGELDHEVLALLHNRVPDLQLVLISNATSRLDIDLRHLGIERIFDQVLNSSALGLAKPNPAIFQAALQIAKVEVGEAVLIDDSIRNIESASRLGIRGHCFQDSRQLKAFLQSVHALHRDEAPAS